MSTRMNVSRENEFSYDIVIESDFSRLSEEIKKLNLNHCKACIITDSNILELYAEKVKSEIKQLFSEVCVFHFQAGEENKNLDTVSSIYEFLIERRFDRKDILIALGGGVTGDITGFAASTYLRGIPFIQIPTTLLAMVDSSIGGKTGVDFMHFKNMVGAFYQPSLVYINIATCQTLPEVEFSCGMGEILKHGLIKNNHYYEWVSKHSGDIIDCNLNIMEEMIRQSCLIKKQIVENDPKEKGDRALLNFGHTIGHAIEKLMNFQLHHGQCVGLGYLAAAYISYKRNLISLDDLETIKSNNNRYCIPNKIIGINTVDVLNATKSDKKMEQGRIKFVLLNKLGNAFIDNTVSDNEILEAVHYISGDK